MNESTNELTEHLQRLEYVKNSLIIFNLLFSQFSRIQKFKTFSRIQKYLYTMTLTNCIFCVADIHDIQRDIFIQKIIMAVGEFYPFPVQSPACRSQRYDIEHAGHVVYA